MLNDVIRPYLSGLLVSKQLEIYLFKIKSMKTYQSKYLREEKIWAKKPRISQDSRYRQSRYRQDLLYIQHRATSTVGPLIKFNAVVGMKTEIEKSATSKIVRVLHPEPISKSLLQVSAQLVG